MRKFLIAVFIIAFANVSAQNTLYSGIRVTPKLGKTSAFETSWKAHLAKYHKGDDGRSVIEILSGDNSGSYLLISSSASFGDLDKERTTDKAHDMDYDMTVTPAVDKVSGSYTYRWVDSLSYNGNVPATKFTTTAYTLKIGKTSDLVAEVRRAIKVNTKINSAASYNTYIKQWAGSKPELMIVTNLKDGFKQLDPAVMTPMNDAFKAEYLKQFGQEMWDKRGKLLGEICESYETYISKLRNDLSTAPMK